MASGREAAELAMKDWVRVKANMNLGAYDTFKPDSAISQPEWPKIGFWDLIKIAFRDHLITPSTIRSSSGCAGSPSARTPSAKWWWWTSSSPPSPASGRIRFVWSLTSCAAGAASEFGSMG